MRLSLHVCMLSYIFAFNCLQLLGDLQNERVLIIKVLHNQFYKRTYLRAIKGLTYPYVS